MCAKIHLHIFSSFLDIWENVEWPRFFGPPGISVDYVVAGLRAALCRVQAVSQRTWSLVIGACHSRFWRLQWFNFSLSREFLFVTIFQ